MKAYSYYNDINFYNYIVFADNVEEAKSMVAVAEGWDADETEDIKLWREPELDAYHDKDIPATALLAAGWELECPNCGAVNSDDNDLPTYADGKAYCGKCGAALVCLEDGVLRKNPSKKLMNKTTVTELEYFIHDFPMTEYECDNCKEEFVDRNDDYIFCPYCGRKIVSKKE